MQNWDAMPALLTAADNQDHSLHVFGGLNQLLPATEAGAPSEYFEISAPLSPDVLRS